MGENEQKVSLIPLGGLGEIGKNMMAIRYGNSILVIDCGLTFPEDEMLGVDVVIPDYSYLIENRHMVKGIIVTHGHEDHIGALPYVLKDLNVPVYGTKLTLALIQAKLKEQGNSVSARLQQVKPRDTIRLGPFKVEFIHVSHSITDTVALAIRTPVGTIVHTSDFKIDYTPIDGEVFDFYKFAQLGEEGVLVLLSDSTNVERTGYTMSERIVGETFDEIFRQSRERIIVASFASNIHRVQQIISTAHKYNRKVAVIGRSMVNVVSIASELGYLNIPEGTLVEVSELGYLPKNEVVIISTGSQGEPMSALTRIARNDHRQIEIVPGDTVIISALPIPGNEKLVSRTVDYLFKQGANVYHEAIEGVHVSGHASQEELKLILSMVKPKYFIPVHGEHRMLIKHAHLAEELGIPPQNIFVAENGQVIDITREHACISGRVSSGRLLIDGLGIGDVGNIVLRDRKQLAQDGLLIVVLTLSKENGTVLAGPDIISRGFVYVREAEELLEEAKEKVRQTLDKCEERKITDWATIKSNIRDSLGKFLYEKTRRRPMILPIIMEV
ncbi:MAG: ribonuclease [Clostridia bacterium]|nr:ribonuclease [Clostridia bacterium]